MSTQVIQLPFGEWLPDLPANQNPGALIAKNVLPQINSYRSLKSLSSFTDALVSACVGAIWAHDENNVVFNFAGDSASLYQLTGGTTWSDVSGLSAPYSAAAWDFAEFTGNRIIAANENDPMQYFDMGVSSVFADLPNAPQANRVAAVRDFLMVGDIVGLSPQHVQWCGFNNSEIWTPSLAYQSDFQELSGPAGKVQRIIGGEFAAIFTEQGLYRADYVGPPVVFQFDEIERKRGTPAPFSVVRSGAHIWYYGYDGFYVFDGQRSQEISANRVSNWFANNSALDALDSMRAAVDRRNRMVLWGFRSTVSLPYNNRLIIYNWAADKWSYAEVDTEILAEFVSPGFSLDDLDTPLPGGIDVDSIPIDSDQFAGGELTIQAFDTSHQGATFDGPPLTGVLDTKEIGGEDHNRLFVNSVRPQIESDTGATVTIQSGTRNRLQDNVNFATAKALNSINGEANMRANARYHRFRCNIAGGFNHGSGVKASVRKSGGRR